MIQSLYSLQNQPNQLIETDISLIDCSQLRTILEKNLPVSTGKREESSCLQLKGKISANDGDPTKQIGQHLLCKVSLVDSPNELLFKIIQELKNPRDLINLFKVNRQFSQLARNDLILETLIKKLETVFIKPVLSLWPFLKRGGFYFKKLKLETCTNEQLHQALMACPHIETLRISACSEELSEATIAQLPNGLRFLSLTRCEKLSDSQLIKITQHCTQLQFLNVFNCPQLTDNAIQAIARNCPELQFLNVSSCRQLTDEAILAIARHCVQLQALDVSNCHRLRDRSIMDIAENCPQLRSLNVSNCRQLTDEAIQTIAEKCSQLRILIASLCDLLTNDSIQEVLKRCSQLEELWVYGCKKLTDDFMMQIPDSCPSLRLLDVGYCNQLTDVFIHKISKHYPGLRSLGIEGCKKISALLLRELTVQYGNSFRLYNYGN